MRLRHLLPAVLALAAIHAEPAAAAGRAVPPGWIGVSAGIGFGGQPWARSEPAQMRRAGVESVRLTIYWGSVQPYARLADVPADRRGRFRLLRGIPTDVRALDDAVLPLARQGLKVVPVVLGAPAWATADRPAQGVPTPRDPALYATFLRTLVERYGPRGSAWRTHPRLRRAAIRSWQIWNEPDLALYWRGAGTGRATWARTYVNLLRAAHQAIHRADRGATVILAGLTSSSTGNVWEDLRHVYEAGGRRWFDVAAVHPYTAQVYDVEYIVRRCRATMARAGDRRTPIAITEFGWTAGKGRVHSSYGWNVSARTMATKARDALLRLARVRRDLRLSGIFWYSWLTSHRGSSDEFEYAGLRSLASGRPTSTPALASFRETALRLAGRRR